MATSGYCDSWVVPNGYVTNQGTSYAGAFYRLHWESVYVSPGVTQVNWRL